MKSIRRDAHTNSTFAYGYRACAVFQKPERRQLWWQETDRIQRMHTDDAHRRCRPPQGGFFFYTIFRTWKYIFNMSCSLLAQKHYGSSVFLSPLKHEVLTVEAKGHDVDSTTYLQYIQNKALFSADTLECSAVFVRPSEQNYRLYNHSDLQGHFSFH